MDKTKLIQMCDNCKAIIKSTDYTVDVMDIEGPHMQVDGYICSVCGSRGEI